jgi:hypothetical protein
MDELIADCADIPASLKAEPAVVPHQREPRWAVNDACAAQVADMDEYV